MQRNLDAGAEFSKHALPVQNNQFSFCVGKIIGQKPAAGSESITGVRNIDLDFKYLHFENITGLGLGNLDRAGQDVATWTTFFHLFMNIAVILRNGSRRHTQRFHLFQ